MSQGLIGQHGSPLSERDVAAWTHILNRLRQREEEIRLDRLRIAHELGFNAVHPRDVKVGDTIRTGAGLWHEVTDRVYFQAEDDDDSYWLFKLDDDSQFGVQDVSEDNPAGPASVLVAIPDDDELGWGF